MRCTSPRCSTGSSRTCAGSSATTSSTSPPSNRSAGSPRISTSPCAAPCPAPSCARCSPPPTTRSGGRTPRPVRYHDDELPVWHEASGNYLDPATGEVLPTWDQALDAIGDRRRAATRRPVRPAIRRPGRHRRIPRRQPVHRLPDQVPDQARRRLPPGRDSRPARAHRPAGRGAALRAVLADMRELAALRHPAQEPPARPAARALPGQSTQPRAPRLRRAPRPGLPQMVRQDPGRPPRRPARHGSWTRSAFRRPTRPATPGNPSPPATPTTCPTHNGCCTSSPTGTDGTPHSP